MRTQLLDVAARTGGVFVRGDALGCGHTDHELRAWVAEGEVRRLRRGVFAVGPGPSYASEVMLESARGLARLHGDAIALSHHTALALHGIAVHGVSCDTVHAVRVSGSVQSSPGFHVHRTRVLPPLTRARGVRTVTPPVAVIQVSADAGVVPGVVAADSAMHHGLAARASLEAEIERRGRLIGAAGARVVVQRCELGAESPGETLLRLIAQDLGLQVELQFPVAEPGHSPFAYADMRIVGTRSLWEFDGAIKYAGASGQQALVSEKTREDRIRRLGWGLDRVIWRDFDDTPALEARIRTAAREHAIR